MGRWDFMARGNCWLAVDMGMAFLGILGSIWAGGCMAASFDDRRKAESHPLCISCSKLFQPSSE
jgi:hypothetical protein